MNKNLKIKKTGLTIVMMLVLFNVNATTYYVSFSSGDDNNNGTSTSSPWKTINKVNASMNLFQPGDNILFNKGDVFYGTINLTKSGTTANKINFGAYGTGNLPVITGLIQVTSWTNTGGNIWEANCPTCDTTINMFLINGKQFAPGRYPNADQSNKGYLTIDAATANTQISDNALLTIPYNFTGADIVVRKNHWILDKGKVDSHNSAIINYSGTDPFYNGEVGYGYFFMNHLKTLDKNGEWCYDFATKKISLYYNGINPNTLNIDVSVLGNLITATSMKNYSIRNITFKGSNKTAALLKLYTNIEIKDCEFLFSGQDAVSSKGGGGGSGIVFENNKIKNTNNVAFQAYAKNVIVRNNDILNTATFPGLGGNGDSKYIGIQVSGIKNIIIENNRIDSTGFNALSFGGDSVLIRNNYITNFCFVKDDGTGIGTINGQTAVYRRVIDNVILNGIGAGEGTQNTGSGGASGVYLDNNTNDVLISGNTIANMYACGIIIHNSHNIKIHNNTIFNCETQLYPRHDDATTFSITNCDIKNNILFSKKADQFVIDYWYLDVTEIANTGSMDSNFYCRPFDEDKIIRTLKRSPLLIENITRALWTTKYLHDGHTKGSPVLYTSSQNPDNEIRFEYAANTVKTINLAYNYVDVYGTYYSSGSTIQIQPYKSIILLRKNVPGSALNLNLTALIEGLYKSTTNTMVSAQTVTVELRSGTSPAVVVATTIASLSTAGTCQLNFISGATGVPYYIVVKHKNALETWSSTKVTFTASPLNYDFTSLASKAYGNNMKLKGTKWCFYSGDVNQDRVIEGDDYTTIYNDASVFRAGPIVTDLNEDNVVETDDATIGYNNAGFIESQHP